MRFLWLVAAHTAPIEANRLALYNIPGVACIGCPTPHQTKSVDNTIAPVYDVAL